MQRNAYSHVSPLCTKRYSKCDILRTLFTINNYNPILCTAALETCYFYSSLLSFFPSLFAHPFLSILSFSFSSQLVDKSLSCTRIYLNNTSVWQTLVSLLCFKYRLHRVSLTTVRCRVSLWKIVVSSSLTQRCVFPSSCTRQNASYSTVICTT